MPKVNPVTGETNAKTVGARVRRLRQARGLKLAELAQRAGVHKNTLLRMEQGHPVTPKVLARVCNSLDTIPPNLTLADEEWDKPYRVHRAAEGDWAVTFNRSHSPALVPDFAPLNDEAERARLGHLGFVSGYFFSHACGLREGQIHGGTLELYGDQERPDCHHAGEEFVLCLRGRIVVEIEGQRIELGEGDSICFRSDLRHRYHAAAPVRKGELPPRLLMLWIEGSNGEDRSGKA